MNAEDKDFTNDENLPLHDAVGIPLKVSPRIALGNLQVDLTTCLTQEI